MKLWILLAIAGLLLFWGLIRERFEATPSIKAPPYGKEEKIRLFGMVHQTDPNPPYSFLGYQDILMDKAKQQLPSETDQEKLKEAAGGLIAPVVEEFFTRVFKPATTPITVENVDTFLASRSSDIKMIERDILVTYFVGQSGVGTSAQTGYASVLAAMGQNPGYLVTSPQGTGTRPTSGGSPPPVCPTGTILDSSNNCVSSETPNFTCPSGYEVRGTKCGRIGGTEATDPVCPAGMTYSSELNACQSAPAPPSCPGGYEFKEGKCVVKASGGATTGTSTGGASVSSYGPTSGGRNRQVFGPVFTAMAAPVDGAGSASRDSSKTNTYPELLGGMPDTSTRIPGAGIVRPSKNWSLTQNGSLPPSSSLGTDENAAYFPYSRQPGDMDIIPDPYRVSKTFSQASYSYKTEPVPFLTDFSAFLK